MPAWVSYSARNKPAEPSATDCGGGDPQIACLVGEQDRNRSQADSQRETHPLGPALPRGGRQQEFHGVYKIFRIGYFTETLKPRVCHEVAIPLVFTALQTKF
jgi:hypothetical protein